MPQTSSGRRYESPFLSLISTYIHHSYNLRKEQQQQQQPSKNPTSGVWGGQSVGRPYPCPGGVERAVSERPSAQEDKNTKTQYQYLQ